ncbi:MAG: C39 family peptidase [Ruminococcus sp.]|nr:C39 family peptidase [Ruminococcus sp.]
MKRLIGAAAFAASAAMLLTSCGRIVEKAENLYQENDTNVLSAEAAEPVNGSSSDADATGAPERLAADLDQPDGYRLAQRNVLSFKSVMQKPSLPTGCEVTALTQTLNYFGFEIDNVTLSDYFLPQDWDGWFTMNDYYLGDPHSENGFGCNVPVLMRAATDYFDYLGSDWYPADLSGTPFMELLYQIDQGRPVIVWGTMDLVESEAVYQFDLGCGDEFWFNDFHHCMTVYGYDLDEEVVYTADPLAGNICYPIDRFETVYGNMGSQAIVLVGNEESAGKDYSDDAFKDKWMHDRHPSWFGEENPDSGEFDYYYEYDNPVDYTTEPEEENAD